MMKKMLLIGTLLSCIAFSACEKTDQQADCEGLKRSLVTDDAAGVKNEINSLASGLVFSSRSPGYEELKEGIDQLAIRLEKTCVISITVLCYGCIETYPTQSEIRIAFMDNGSLTEKTIDLSVDTDKRLVCVSMHE